MSISMVVVRKETLAIAAELGKFPHHGSPAPAVGSVPGVPVDKFLVQAISLAPDTYDAIEGKPADVQTDTLSKLWSATDKGSVAAAKLTTSFRLADGGGEEGATASASGNPRKRRSIKEADDGAGGSGAAAAAAPAGKQVAFTKPTTTRAGGPAASEGAAVGAPAAHVPADRMTMEDMLAELFALRKKHDELLQATVNITAERDFLAGELKVSKRRNLDLQQAGSEAQAAVAEGSNGPKEVPNVYSGVLGGTAAALVAFVFGWVMRG